MTISTQPIKRIIYPPSPKHAYRLYMGDLKQSPPKVPPKAIELKIEGMEKVFQNDIEGLRFED